MSRTVTVNKYLVSELGPVRALLVETFIMLWLMFELAEGRPPERIDELAQAIGKHQATVFRWQADFREAFPQYATPRDLIDALGIAARKPVTIHRVGSWVLA